MILFDYGGHSLVVEYRTVDPMVRVRFPMATLFIFSLTCLLNKGVQKRIHTLHLQ